jgi:hypothetical protein
MLRNGQYWLLSILAVMSLALVISNMELTRVNQALQSQVAARNQTVQQGVQLDNLYQQIAHTLADLAVQNKDERLRAMLASNGIKVTEPGQPSSGTHR